MKDLSSGHINSDFIGPAWQDDGLVFIMFGFTTLSIPLEEWEYFVEYINDTNKGVDYSGVEE